MDNELSLDNMDFTDAANSWGRTMCELEDEFRKLSLELGKITFTYQADGSLSFSLSETNYDEKWAEDDGKEISNYLERFKIIE